MTPHAAVSGFLEALGEKCVGSVLGVAKGPLSARVHLAGTIPVGGKREPGSTFLEEIGGNGTSRDL